MEWNMKLGAIVHALLDGQGSQQVSYVITKLR